MASVRHIVALELEASRTRCLRERLRVQKVAEYSFREGLLGYDDEIGALESDYLGSARRVLVANKSAEATTGGGNSVGSASVNGNQASTQAPNQAANRGMGLGTPGGQNSGMNQQQGQMVGGQPGQAPRSGT